MDRTVFFQDCIAELYPFTEGELFFFKEELNFKYVSANQNINWTYTLIKEFEEQWDWEVLDSNKAVFKKVTLGLLFPDRVELPQCTCHRQEEFCEEAECAINAGRLQYSSSLSMKNGTTYIRLAILCGTLLIEEEMVFELYINENITLVQELIESSFNNS